MSCIYYGIYPNGSYIGQTIHSVEDRGYDHLIAAFGNGNNNGKLGDIFHEYIRKHGLKSAKQVVFYEPYFGVDRDLLEEFRNSMITANGPLSALDAAEILHIMKGMQLGTQGKFNTLMGGQSTIIKIRQANGQEIDSLLSHRSTPQEAYNRLAMAEIRQQDLNTYIDRFYNVLFTDEGKNFASFAQSKKEIEILEPSFFDLTWNDYINNYVFSKVSAGSEGNNKMTDIYDSLHSWIVSKFSVLYQLLPQYLDKDRKNLDPQTRRSFDGISKNLKQDLMNFDEEASKQIRSDLYRIVGQALTRGKYVYTGRLDKLRGGLYEQFFKNIDNSLDDIKNAIKKTLTEGIKAQIRVTLSKIIRVTNTKLRPDATGWGKFLKWNPQLNPQDCSEYFKDETQKIFNLKADVITKRRSVLNRVDRANYTYINENFSILETKHTRNYKKENNAIRMNFLPAEDQLYYAMRESYKDTEFYHSGFAFYRPLIAGGRKNKGYAEFEEIDSTYINQYGEEQVRHGISDRTPHNGYYLLYRSQHIQNSDEIIVY